MLKNISLRHLIPLLFFAGSILLVVFFYFVGLPAAQSQATEVAKRETHTLILSQQSRMIELLVEDEPLKLSKEIYFTSTDPSVYRMLIVDEAKKIVLSNRSNLVGKTLSESGLTLANTTIPFPTTGISDIRVEEQPGSNIYLNGFAALRFRKDSIDHNYTLVVIRNYSELLNSLSNTAAIPSELLATFMLTLSILAIVVLRQHLDARLSPLLSTAAKLAQGEDSARAKLKGADEFAEIGKSFDLMAERLEVYHQDLKEAKENAEKASQAKNHFLGFMSHEIQTPLAGLLGFMELLKETRLDEEARLYVMSAESATRTLSGLMNDLLETSRLETGSIQAQNEVFCVNSLLQDLVDSVLPRTHKKGLNVKIICNETDPIWVESDPRIHRQILMNLLGNAVQFTEEGQITIIVSATALAGPHIHLMISIADSGIGIQPHDIGKIFDRFYKSSDPRVQATPGSGVGLAICQELAETIGAKISVESTLDVGSTFTVEMDAMAAEAPNDFNYSVLTQREQKPQNVLLVENSEITRSLMRSILEKWGHKVVPCKGSVEAIQTMTDRLIYPNQAPITMIFMDIHLPGLNGFEAIKEIRGLDTRYLRTPIIATSTQATPEMKDQIQKAGFDGFVPKPIDRHQMAEEVFRLTRLRKEPTH